VKSKFNIDWLVQLYSFVSTRWHCASLARSVSSNNVYGRSIMMWDHISSLRQLINNSQKKSFVMAFIWKAKCSKEIIKSSIVPDCFNLVIYPKWWVSMSKNSYNLVTNCYQETYPWRAFIHHFHHFHRSGSKKIIF
jgi:hypothetical protein